MLAILGLGNGELIIILVILLLMFGATKLPQLAKGLGKSVKEFKKASSESDADDAADEAKDEGAEAPAKKQIAAKTRKQLPAPSPSEDAEGEDAVSDSARSEKRR